MKKIFLCLIISSLLATTSSPGGTLRKMLEFVSNTSSKEKIANYVGSYVDYHTIAAEIAGRKAWLAADASTRSAYVNKLRKRLLDYYAGNLSNLNRYRFAYTARHGSLRQTIKIYNPNGSTATLVIFYRGQAGKWLIVDSSYNGLSMIAYWRSKLSQAIKTRGLLGI